MAAAYAPSMFFASTTRTPMPAMSTDHSTFSFRRPPCVSPFRSFILHHVFTPSCCYRVHLPERLGERQRPPPVPLRAHADQIGGRRRPQIDSPVLMSIDHPLAGAQHGRDGTPCRPRRSRGDRPTFAARIRSASHRRLALHSKSTGGGARPANAPSDHAPLWICAKNARSADAASISGASGDACASP